jgi:cytochrome c biogenesis protein
MTETSNNATQPASKRSIVLDFLGSMNLAITVLVVIAIASIIGTVLQQNRAYNDYIIEFGPFWHEFFKLLDLYDVYGAGWFVFLLMFLLTSTSVCIYRNAPTMLREMRNFRLNSKIKIIRAINNAQTWEVASGIDTLKQRINNLFRANGFRTRTKQHDDRFVISAMRGQWNRFGYILAHVGMVVVPLGFILDGSFDLQLREWAGKSRIDTETVFVKDMPKESLLQPGDLWSFRGDIDIAEGQKANFTFLRSRDGNMVQYLPFAIELKDFRVEHYESGQPKSFESDLIIHDTEKNKVFEQTIAVNHPLEYRGYTIYQARFGDGGSTLKLKVWPFNDYLLRTSEIEGVIRGQRVLSTRDGDLTIEFIDFKKYNVEPAPADDPLKRKFMNLGSSVVFKVRDKTGAAREYINYMSPVESSGRLMLITGMRGSPAESYRYLHIPIDDKGGIDRFMKFHALLNNASRIQEIAVQTVNTLFKDAKDADKYKQNIVKSMGDVLDLFNEGGFEAIGQFIQNANVSEDQRTKMGEAYFKVLNTIMQAAYTDILQQEGVDLKEGVPANLQQYYADAVDALRQVPLYGTPFFLQLTDFKHVESSGLSIAKLPGKNVFYLGSIMVIIGVFLLFYLSHQRLWVVIYQGENGQYQLTFAGSGNRHEADFNIRFEQLKEQMQRLVAQHS